MIESDLEFGSDIHKGSEHSSKQPIMENETEKYVKALQNSLTIAMADIVMLTEDKEKLQSAYDTLKQHSEEQQEKLKDMQKERDVLFKALSDIGAAYGKLRGAFEDSLKELSEFQTYDGVHSVGKEELDSFFKNWRTRAGLTINDKEG